ncbi:MAG: PrsW family glutamic-type intramembrane protease [Acidobacteriota bacterium]
MHAALLAVSAIAPSLLLVWFFYARDAYPEPPRVLWTTFGLGIVIVAPVLIFAWPMYQLAQSIEQPLLHGLIAAFFGAAIPEETFKLLVLHRYSMRQPAFDEPMDGLVYGATASLGFATLENILYVADGGAPSALLRALTAVPGHAMLGAIMGYYVGRARFSPSSKRRQLLFRAWAVPTLLHGGYDFPLMAASKLEQPDSWAAAPILALLLLVPMILAIESIWTLRLVQGARQAQLEGPPHLPHLPETAVARTDVSPVSEPVATSTPQATPKAPTTRSPSFVGWLLTVSGGLLASVGSLVMLGVVLGVMADHGDVEGLSDLVLGTVILGVAPAGLGWLMFLRGIRRLNRA